MCAIRWMLGFDCPGCGLLHAFWYLAQGDVGTSVHWHPMGVVFVFWAGLLLGQRVRWLQLSALMNRIVAHSVLAGLFVTWMIKLF